VSSQAWLPAKYHCLYHDPEEKEGDAAEEEQEARAEDEQ
jgi:hypothetical protein